MKERARMTNRIGAHAAKTRLPEPPRSVDAAAAVDRFRSFMHEHPLKPGRRIDVRKLVAEGRE
jgi:hypothetical protein